jgi:hypothetical protein
MATLVKDRKSNIALFTAKHILANSEVVRQTVDEHRMYLLDESVARFILDRIVNQLALEYLVAKKVPRRRRITRVVRGEMSLLFSGHYDNEFEDMK